MYWVYDLPNLLFELLTVALFIAFSLVGLFASRKRMRRMHETRSYNDIVGFYLAAITVLYGVTLGLLAVGVWTTFTETQGKVAQEAAAVSTLDRTVQELPEPIRTVLDKDLRYYARRVIDIGWPEQERGILPLENRAALDIFQKDLESWTPVNSAQEVLEADISRDFDALEQSRSIRLDSAAEEMPTPLWALIMIGALICIVLTWFFHMESLKIHVWMTILFAGLLGLMVFMVAALDNPYRGKIKVSPEPLERVYLQMTTKAK